MGVGREGNVLAGGKQNRKEIHTGVAEEDLGREQIGGNSGGSGRKTIPDNSIPHAKVLVETIEATPPPALEKRCCRDVELSCDFSCSSCWPSSH